MVFHEQPMLHHMLKNQVCQGLMCIK